MTHKTFRQLVEETLYNKNEQLDEGIVRNIALAGAIAGSVASVSSPVERFSSHHVLASIPYGNTALIHREDGHNAASYITSHHAEMVHKFGKTHPHIFGDLAINPHTPQDLLDEIPKHKNADADALWRIAEKTKNSKTLDDIATHHNLDYEGASKVAENVNTSEETMDKLYTKFPHTIGVRGSRIHDIKVLEKLSNHPKLSEYSGSVIAKSLMHGLEHHVSMNDAEKKSHYTRKLNIIGHLTDKFPKFIAHLAYETSNPELLHSLANAKNLDSTGAWEIGQNKNTTPKTFKLLRDRNIDITMPSTSRRHWRDDNWSW